MGRLGHHDRRRQCICSPALTEVAGVDPRAIAASGDASQTSALGNQHTADVATAAMTGRYIGPLIATVAFVRFSHSTLHTAIHDGSDPLPHRYVSFPFISPRV
jgi:hypothetical protein